MEKCVILIWVFKNRQQNWAVCVIVQLLLVHTEFYIR